MNSIKSNSFLLFNKSKFPTFFNDFDFVLIPPEYLVHST